MGEKMTCQSMLLLASIACCIAHAAPCLPREAFVSQAGISRYFPSSEKNHGFFCDIGCRSDKAGRIISTKMVLRNVPGLPDLFGRMMLPSNGGVNQQREELNRLHMERELTVERIKRKMRAASYDFGGQDWCLLFTRFDKDNNGMIDFPEFEQLCRHMGLQPHQMSVEEMWIVFEEVDGERRGSIEVTDFRRWLGGKTNDQHAAVVASDGAQLRKGGTTKIKGEEATIWTYGGVGSIAKTIPEEISSRGRLGSVMGVHLIGQDVKLRSTDKTQVKGTVDQLLSEISAFVDAPGEQLRETIYYLLNEIGLSRNKVLGLAITSPNLFSMSLDLSIRPQVEYLREIGVPTTRVGKMLVSFPQILELSIDKKEATVRFLESLGIPLHSVGKCLSQQPQLLGLSVDSKLAPTVDFLMKECLIPRSKIGTLIATFPTVLAYSIETTLAPRLAFILNELKVPQDRLASLLLKFPQLLGLAIEANVQPTIRYLIEDIGIPEVEISKIVQQHPQILGLSIEANLKPKVAFLVEEIGVPKDKLARIVASFPTLLSLSVDMNLRPKFKYLVDEGGFSREDILKAPNLLAYSLKQRIQPRVEFIRSCNSKMALHSILCLSNSDFSKRFEAYRPAPQ